MKTTYWRPVPGYEKWYEVSSRGQVKSIGTGQGRRTGKLLKQTPTVHGYVALQLQVDLKTRNVLVHTLVAEAFLGPCPDGMEVDHIDGVKTNNAWSNLRYVTRSVNMIARNERRRKLGLPLTGMQHGENNPRAKLDWEKVTEIRRRGTSESQQKLAAEFGIGREAVGKILRWERWTKP